MAGTKCPGCQREIPDDLRVCTECGCPITKTDGEENENTLYKVTLVGCNTGKLTGIKALRTIMSWDLVSAKNAIEGTPTVIAGGLNATECENLRYWLEKSSLVATVSVDPDAKEHNDAVGDLHYAKSTEPPPPSCPSCGSESFETKTRRAGLFGLFGPAEKICVCLSCKNKFKPKNGEI